MQVNPANAEYLPLIDCLYEKCKSKFRDAFPETEELWEVAGPPGVKAITYGRNKEETTNGVTRIVPLESVMTLGSENCSEQALDFIFCFKKTSKYSFTDAQLEHMLCEKYKD